MGSKFLLEGVTLSTLRDWLNENNKKKKNETIKEFTINDVKAYCRRGHLPKHMGGNKIMRFYHSDPRIKVYNLLKEDGEEQC